ncbi:hypothetical protein GCM10011399_12620 [Subtercola lobariae]|uniref:Uncharacterized protein n=1 Tax=Subtercola lobariae TaxID=1588641 RepID=A0A917EXV1_9MICO|nr:hypothetical protein GCM10011399_12620 [Subtercola lobariae]
MSIEPGAPTTSISGNWVSKVITFAVCGSSPNRNTPHGPTVDKKRHSRTVQNEMARRRMARPPASSARPHAHAGETVAAL